MTELGKILKNSRNKKFLTIEEVSRITKIKEHYISALEEDIMENLPARVYTVGFLKNLADLYELSAVDLILAYDNLKNGQVKNKSTFKGLGKDLTYSEEIKPVNNFPEIDYQTKKSENDLLEDNNYSFDKIKELSIDKDENYENSLSMIDDYIQKSQNELKDISTNFSSDTNNIEGATDGMDNTYPTTKIMLEFEELMREEERFNTQKLRKQETERNINMTKNRMKNKKSLNLEVNKKNGGNIMILVLLGIAIIVLLYIIITAIINR
ncbi:MAG: helix-turn-helix domain-containing protein [Fusobacteria bacterium]|nr:helix-turn-helix domain-containing protein [Fusobacteriota bacterium]